MSLGRTAALTDTGRKRRHNEDVYVVDPPIFAIADGMGGANAGEVAAGLAADALREAEEEGRGEEAVVTLIQEANRRVYQRATEDAAASGMGTTMTVALLEDGRVRIGHVGDSRAYLIRDGELVQLTDDHSLVGELVRSGKLTPEDAESHPQRSVITRALGTDPDVDVDTATVETRAGDLFLLCSDGLYSMVGNDRILQLVERHRGDLDTAAKALIAAANKGGGEDNITVVAFEIAGAEDETLHREPAVTAERTPDEEDTLTEVDRVPAVTTMVVPPEEAEAFAEPEPEQRPAPPRPPRKVLALLVLILVAIAATVIVYLLVR
ncbi:MAG TPA: Stp1/IreP family PP2C-type Ser/Thr phosphatase [Gaiellaceae bacterium]|jgi:protein phosphatase|nr:Stp1/IreP family PP2C-type Ser/Thr phosphatase [Gaiellaceae bacterium]